MKVAERRIAGLVIARGQVSKAEIESALGYSHPTVVNAVGALVAEGVLRESGEFNSTGGRRAKAISPNPSFRSFGGVDVTRNHVTFVLLDWAGKVVARERRRRPFSARPGDLRELGAAFRAFASAKGVAVASVGVSLPGILSHDRLRLVRSHALALADLDLSPVVAGFGGLAVVFENDANAAAEAELAGLSGDTVYLSLSNTVGGAFCRAGDIYLGDNRRAGEFGHMVLHPGGRRCYCGKRGCADPYLSALRLADRVGGLEGFFARLKAGNKAAAKAWHDYAADLAIAVTNLRMAYDCDVMIGGYVGAFAASHRAEIERGMAGMDIFENDFSFFRIACHGFESSAIGAAIRLRDEAVELM